MINDNIFFSLNKMIMLINKLSSMQVVELIMIYFEKTNERLGLDGGSKLMFIMGSRIYRKFQIWNWACWWAVPRRRD